MLEVRFQDGRLVIALVVDGMEDMTVSLLTLNKSKYG
jgi:hypothetical protein